MEFDVVKHGLESHQNVFSSLLELSILSFIGIANSSVLKREFSSKGFFYLVGLLLNLHVSFELTLGFCLDLARLCFC